MITRSKTKSINQTTITEFRKPQLNQKQEALGFINKISFTIQRNQLETKSTNSSHTNFHKHKTLPAFIDRERSKRENARKRERNKQEEKENLQ